MRTTSKTTPAKFPAGLLALLVHGAFIALLVFGLSWKTKQEPPVEVEMWSSLPAGPAAPVVEPTPAPPPPPPPVLEKREPPKPAPAPVEKPAPAPDPEIALKKKEDEKKQRLLEEKRELDEKKAREEKLEREKQEKEKAREIAETKAAEKKAADDAKKAAAAKAAAEGAARSAADAVIGEYTERIRAKIKRSTQVPDSVTGRPTVVMKLVILPTGEVLSATIAKSSGNPAFDEAVERGIIRAQPLPLPEDKELFPRFRNQTLNFTHDK